MPKLIVVVGATGQQGGSVVNFLLKEPAGTFFIRGITRDVSSPASQALVARGVEMIQADLSSLEETTAAFRGADSVFGVTQFYEHGFEKEQLHGSNIVDACIAAKVSHLVWSTVEGREGECGAISWKSKALIEDKILAAGIPYTFVYIPMYYENFWTAFFAPSWDAEKGVVWGVGFLPDVPIFAMSVEDFGGWVVPALREPEKYIGKKIKIVVEYLSLRDMGTQFTEVTGEKAGLAFEMTREQFEQSRYADHPAAEFMYLSWEYVIRAGPDSGVRDKKQTLEIYPEARTYKEWLKTSALPKQVLARIKAEAAEKSSAK